MRYGRTAPVLRLPFNLHSGPTAPVARRGRRPTALLARLGASDALASRLKGLISGGVSPAPMAEEAPPATFTRKLRTFLRTYRFAFSILVLAVGAFLSVLAVGFFTPLNTAQPFVAINSATNQPTANYNLLFVVVGPITAIIGAYLVGAYYLARHRFEHLMVTRSKAEFLRNIPEVEDLLWDLTPDDEQRYSQKLADLRIRR